jgi:hypothetical protein
MSSPAWRARCSPVYVDIRIAIGLCLALWEVRIYMFTERISVSWGIPASVYFISSRWSQWGYILYSLKLWACGPRCCKLVRSAERSCRFCVICVLLLCFCFHCQLLDQSCLKAVIESSRASEGASCSSTEGKHGWISSWGEVSCFWDVRFCFESVWVWVGMFMNSKGWAADS